MSNTGEDAYIIHHPPYVIEIHESLDSTNEYALSLGGMDRRVIVAKQQTRGRGRYGRHWESLPGCLAASLILAQTTDVVYSLKMAAAVIAAIESLNIKATVQYKWPNDVLIDGKKVCGILPETDACGNVIIGLGINVAQGTSSFSHIGCYHDIGGYDLLFLILTYFEEKYFTSKSTLHTFLSGRMSGMGQHVTVASRGNESSSGKIAGLADDFGLLLRTEQSMEIINFGEVI